ncbi:ABC transporter ATP-binding protein [Alsobacter metallidurans]|uniref:ABC transporter ATP-binding protein n=1 Tax=Alsobacter metallidurans TaxID=340221 RepID=A0A917MHV3_9HYPH|nr:ABC transporter ATP-binding protein [Alsobacter metallidurans]GGH22710.1 ABC transporter ATP-binding protein [Alsobacter metallidurans]
MSEPLIRIEGLRKSFGALVVTDDVSLDVAPGELHALIGPNGAGKTTLIHQIAGTLQPNAGRILIGGVDLSGASPAARARAGLARTFQITSIIPTLDVLGNVALAAQARSPRALRLFGRAATDEALNAQARAAIAAVGLSARAGAPAGMLSHGEKRVLEIAMALAMEPKAILLDEPMAGVGREESARIVELLLGLKGRYAMLLVEHDMEAVFSLADRISVLVYGSVIATGTPDAIRVDPAVRAAYLGDEAA